ncbi:tyrosine-protein phosphatase [Kerstersia sp.]|uniref:tyrosine-protein phosphatase n=1 Tax=Kerstersia sp. TaxID=1930783 RepID=UPI003F8ED6ED
MDNLRDVAGVDADSTYVAAGGHRLRRGVFYRSNALSQAVSRAEHLDSLGLTAVYDLRTPSEVARQPDVLPAGTAYVQINILGQDNVVFGTLSSAADTVAAMQQLQRDMVTQAAMRERLGELFTALANGADAQLYHCTGGKDRTGWVSALLQLHAGVSQEDVMHDYLLTNQRMTAFIEQNYAAVAAQHGKAAAEAILPALSVRESFLQTGLDQLQQDFGSVQHYLGRGLGLDDSLQERLRARLLA